jgi:Big-like domain-containing protein
MRCVRFALAVVLIAFPTGCNDKGPAAPTQVPTVTDLVISGLDDVLTSMSTNYSAVVTLSDGTKQPVTPTWTTSNSRVASVDAAGRLEGLAHGSTRLTASYAGREASKTVRVINNYGGIWTGTYVIKACEDSGDLTDRDGGWCRTQSRVGSVWPIVLTLSHSTTNPTEVTRTFPGTDDKVTGSVTEDGRLNIGGTLPLRDFDYPDMIIGTVQFMAWDTNLSGSSEKTGRWSEKFVSFVFRIGSAVTEHELVTMTRTYSEWRSSLRDVSSSRAPFAK